MKASPSLRSLKLGPYIVGAITQAEANPLFDLYHT